MMQPAGSPAPRPPEIPLTFRQEIVPHVFHAIRGGWSCALAGVTGVGMSNVLRFICESRVVTHYLGDDAPLTLPVYVESGPLADAQEVCRAAMRALAAGARILGWPKADQAALRSLVDRGAPDAAQALAEIVDYLCGDRQRRIVVVLDEFDRTFVDLPAAGLRALRRLRDDHKFWFSFVAGTRVELAGLLDRRTSGAADAEKFAELFDEHTFPLRPYAHADALTALARKAFDWEQGLSAEQQDRLYRAAGGHAKLLSMSLTFLFPRRHLPWPEVERGLCENAALAEVCRAVWEDLDVGEQAAALALAADRRAEIDAADLDRLRLKGLVVGRPDYLFATIFEAFVRRRLADQAGEPEPARRMRLPSKLRDPDAQALYR